MPAERFYIDADLQPFQELILQNQEFHHLARVMRAKVGDFIELVNGKGLLAQAKVLKIGKKEAYLEIGNLEKFPKPVQKLILAQGLPRGPKLDFILEKCTELGVTDFWLFPGELSERKEMSSNQLERSQGILIAAMKQCGRTWLPEIILKPPIREWKNVEFACFFGDVSSEAPFLSDPIENAIFCVGPESGFSSHEEAHLIEMGAKGVKLNSNILRTDTAAMMGIGLLSFLMHSQNG